MDSFLFLVAGVGIFTLLYLGFYNGLARTRRKVKKSWIKVEKELKVQYELVAGIIEAIKKHAPQEETMIELISQARIRAIAVPNGSAFEQAKAEKHLREVLGSIITLLERYPELRIDNVFKKLRVELVNIQDQICATRCVYNGNVNIYNTKAQIFPSTVLTKIHGFELAEFFETKIPETKTRSRTSRSKL